MGSTWNGSPTQTLRKLHGYPTQTPP